MKSSKNTTHYWNHIADNWQHTSQQRVLRSVSDILNSKLFAAWLPPEKVQCLLKTDLFDESLTNGLYPLLAQHANKVVGIDISADIVTSTRKRHKHIEAIQTDVRQLPFPPESFDVIISNSTLDHFKTSDDIIASLIELKRVLRKDGQLLITLDNLANPTIFLRNVLPFKMLNRLGIVPYYVGATFGPRRLSQVLSELDFSVSELTSFWHFPRICLVLMASIADRFGSDIYKQRLIKAVLSFERLSQLPTKHLTGQFVAARAIKR